MSEIHVNGVTYRQQYRKCGKAECRCAEGDSYSGELLHGPYWYAFGDGYSPKYVGKNLPQWVLDHRALVDAERDQIKTVKDQVQARLTMYEQEVKRAQAELDAVSALLRGDYANPSVLDSIDLGKFAVNGHHK